MKIEKVQRHTLKVLSVLLAVSLWFYVLNSEPIEIEKKLKINYVLPNGMAMMSFSETELTLKIKGSKAFVSNLLFKKDKYTVDLTPYYQTSGKSFRVKFYTNSIEVPFGVEVLDISPKETQIELDKSGTIEVPVKLQMFGDLPKNRKLNNFKIMPDTLFVTGPLELLKTISKIETVPLNLSMLNKDDGAIVLQSIPLDPRLNIKDKSKLEFTYKTKKVNF